MKFPEIPLCLMLILTSQLSTHAIDLAPTNIQDIIQYLNVLNNSHTLFPSNATITRQTQQFDSLFNFKPSSLVNMEFDNSFDSVKNVSSDCKSQILYFIKEFRAKRIWTFKTIDSYAKLPSGILRGHLTWLGEFNECRNISAGGGKFTGKYAILVKSFNPSDFLKPDFSSLKYGLCVPRQCSKVDIVNVINFVITLIDLSTDAIFPINLKNIDTSNVQIQETHKLDGPAIATLSIIGLMGLFVLVGTLYDVCKRYRYNLRRQTESYSEIVDDSSIGHDLAIPNETLYFNQLKHEHVISQILVSFSAYSNTKKIFKISSDNKEFKCLHGIRVLSLCWVILGHSHAFTLAFSDNVAVFLDMVKHFSYLIVSNAFFSVDSFFLLSGFLTAYVFLKEVANRKITPFLIFKYLLHRFWRLSPPYFVCILISANLSAYFGIGPLYPVDGFEINKCRDTWFWNILYANNLIDPDHMCFAVSWYLANDMQFHVIAPLILIPLALKKYKLGFSIMLILLIGNTVSIPIILYLNPGLESAQFGTMFVDFFKKLYILPWCRIAPYLFGMFTGNCIYLYKNRQAELNLPKITNVCLWLISITLMSAVVFGLYPDISGNPISQSGHIIYQTFSRIAWSIGLSYAIFACITSNGGFINTILSWPVWIPLSRLSYSTFLVHYMFIIYAYASRDHLIHIENLEMVYLYVSNLLLSYSLGYLLSISFELPLLSLEKLL